jgi:threonyl-tRNA synthetase
VTARLRAAGIRAQLDAGSQTLNYRIREGEVHKVPYLAIVGQREADAGTVAVRVRGATNKQEVVAVEEFITRLKEQVAKRELVP